MKSLDGIPKKKMDGNEGSHEMLDVGTRAVSLIM